MLTDGANDGCRGDCHAFKGPAYRYLKELYDETANQAHRAVLAACVNALWNLARNPDDELFSVDWTGPPMTSYSEPQSAAAVMALNIYPPLVGPYPGTGAPAGRYEAEDATIEGVSLEARHGDFTGWGYVAAWNGDGRQVTFTVRVPAAGPYTLTFRYAAEAGEAVRLLRIDGAAVVSRLRFPATNQWSAYGTVASQRVLAAGTHRIALVFDDQAGSENYLNLDYLQVEPVAPSFVRGDANSSNSLDIADAIFLLSHLFAAGPAPGCKDAGDANDDGGLDIGDAIKILGHLFGQTGPLPVPFGACGPDATTDLLGCERYPHCQ